MNDKNNPEHTGTITGIPVGTRYTIEEVESTDGAKLQSVTVPPHNKADVINNMVEGEIVESKDPNDPTKLEVTAIFTNTKRTLINIEFDKLWKDANGKDDLSTAKRQDKSTSSSSAAWQPAQTIKNGNR